MRQQVLSGYKMVIFIGEKKFNQKNLNKKVNSQKACQLKMKKYK